MLMERVEMVYHDGTNRIEAGKITPPNSKRRLVEQHYFIPCTKTFSSTALLLVQALASAAWSCVFSCSH